MNKVTHFLSKGMGDVNKNLLKNFAQHLIQIFFKSIFYLQYIIITQLSISVKHYFIYPENNQKP